MKIIEHSYGADLDWVEPLTSKLEGKTEGNFIIAPENIYTGYRYFLDCGDDITALYVDVVYHTEICFIQKHTKDDFIGIYYNLTEGQAEKSSDDFLYNVGRLGYNVSIIDSILETNYHVMKGSKTFAVCIFLKKSTVESFIRKNNNFSDKIDKLMDAQKNTFIKFDRMSYKSMHLLKDLQKMQIGGAVFDLSLIATAHLVVSDYLNQLLNETIVIERVDNQDLLSIIKIQTFLMENVAKAFPSIKSLARKANMSESKFKMLFNKITGITPNAFYMANKLVRAKELIQEEGLTITEVTERLRFGNNSYFISKFKKHFAVSPLTFIKKLS